MTFIGDLSTRALLCQLDPHIERPEERSFATNLHKYIPENRPRLVSAGLTILRAFHIAGRPIQNIRQFGRFEEWSDWIDQQFVWLGLSDPCLTRKEIESIDPVRMALGAFFSAWFVTFGSSPVKAKELIVRAQDGSEDSAPLYDALLSLISTNKGEFNERALGNKLKNFKNRIEQGYRLEIAGERQGTTLWKVVKIF